METLQKQKENPMKEFIDPKKEAINLFTKVWQTHTRTQESPIYNLSEYNAREKDQSKIKGIITQDVHDFLNNDS